MNHIGWFETHQQFIQLCDGLIRLLFKCGQGFKHSFPLVVIDRDEANGHINANKWLVWQVEQIQERDCNA